MPNSKKKLNLFFSFSFLPSSTLIDCFPKFVHPVKWSIGIYPIFFLHFHISQRARQSLSAVDFADSPIILNHLNQLASPKAHKAAQPDCLSIMRLICFLSKALCSQNSQYSFMFHTLMLHFAWLPALSVPNRFPLLINTISINQLTNQWIQVINGRSFPFCCRDKLPSKMIARANISLWSILKNCIGKELSKITMPVLFNEPLSFLQRLTENVAYIDLIDKANESSDPLERMEVRWLVGNQSFLRVKWLDF